MQALASGISLAAQACRTGLESFVKGVVTVIASAYLLFLYIFTIWLVVGSLSAIQVRDDLVDQDGSVSFAGVEQAMIRLETEAIGMRESLYASDKIRAKAEQKQSILERLGTQIQLASLWTYTEPQIIDSPAFQKLISSCKTTEDSNDLACQLLKDYYELDSEYLALLESGEPAKFESLRIQTEHSIRSMQENEPLSKYFDMYRFFSALRYGKFLQEPPQILVLQVTLAMGMLGSIVSLTWSFIRADATLTLRRFLLMPFVGMMSAFIILVLVKAGQITITSGAANDSLSPFFLSFVGIISGLLSERAYIRISEVGGSFFSVKDDQPRYGVRLGEALDAEGIEPAELGRRLNMAEADISSLVSQTRTASLSEQNLISAYLRRNVREIFTDLPPVGAPEANAATVRVPRLIGSALGDAEAALASAGLALGARKDTPSTGKPAGEIVSQTPAPDELVARGSRVDIEVSSPESAGN